MITPEQLRAWADDIDSEQISNLNHLTEKMRQAADLLAAEVPHPRLEGVPMLPANLYGYAPVPRFLRADRWPVTGVRARWYLMGPAADLLEAETVDVKQLSGGTTTVTPLEPIGWRMVKKKGHGSVLYVLMTFERAVYDESDNPLGGVRTTR